MTGARALAGAMLVLAGVCAVPAVSVAQDSGVPAVTTTTTGTTPDPLPTPPPATEPVNPPKTGDAPAGGDQSTSTQASAQPPVTVTSGTGGKAHAAASASVTIGDFFFSPASVTVAVGDTVTWHNTGQAPHTATANDGSFDTGTINPGQSASHKFSSAGTFTYVCTIHPNMHGTIRVLSASGGGSGGGGTAGSSSTGSGPSEASAVNSPNAAGSSSTLPATGLAAGTLALVGFALLSSGLIARLARARL